MVGAGAFGGWTALHLRRAGVRVALLDAWGPGHGRASSGGDTRVLRHTYGDRIYVDLAARALSLWLEHEARWGRPLFRRTGALWMAGEAHAGEAHAVETAALEHLRGAGIEHERWDVATLGRRYPQINTDGVRWAIHEPTAGYLLARRACRAVADALVAEGGEVRVEAAVPGPIRGDAMDGLRTADGRSLHADHLVLACGSWLAGLLPDLLGTRIRPTRQEVFVFGPGRGDTRHGEGALPIWIDHGERFWYGIPGNDGRGFKIADDTRGAPIDPTTDERLPSAEGLARARAHMEHRFPGLRGAPLLESRVCPYENTPDRDFILDRHPGAANVWIVGGGSGHGFKHGPAIGEVAAAAILGNQPAPGRFALARFDPAPA